MAAELEKFKFPDEVDGEQKDAAAQQDEELKVEVIDDTPPADKGREPLPQEIVKQLDEDDLEDYSEKVKKRLGQMKKVWHDERREKEQATREREEALRFAEAKDAEVKQLRARIGRGEQIFVTEVSKAAANEIAVAKDKLKRAYEAGDAELIADAQEALTDAKLRLRDVQQMRPALQSQEDGVQTPPIQAKPPAQVSDPKAEAWRQKNTWFGVDEEMTSLALGLHEKLVRSGLDPRSDEYYRRVDGTMRKRFPENFEEEPTQTREVDKPAPRKSVVVAPATRSTAPKTVQLTTTQMALAKRFKLTPEAYAREVLKLESNNG